MKVLFFGGSFDPPHMGHMELLRGALEQLEPDVALVMPAGLPPHKRACGTPGQLRYQMCRAFLRLDGRVSRSRYELERPGPSYTADTLAYLQRRWPGAEFYLLIGSDMLLSFTKWRRWNWLLANAVLVAHCRDEADRARLVPAAQALRAAGGRVILLDQPVLPVSSTAVRARCQRGEPLEGLVPEEALQVIRRYRLYQGPLQAGGCPVTAEYCKKLAKRILSGRRYRHTLNVSRLAVKLARQFGADPEKARIAGLLHDICKERPRQELLQMLRDNAIMTQNAAEKPQGVWHAAAAMVYARQELGIEDPQILDAIRYHTSCRAGMTQLDKVVYMADMCSDDRDYPEVEELRRLLKKDLDRALLRALQYSLKWLREDKKPVDEDSRLALEQLKRQGVKG